MNNTEKFTKKAATYSIYRPNYPSAYIEYLIQSLSLELNNTITDIGSGTGILTQQLLEKGFHVHAVEPNENMRLTAETNLNKYPNFISHNASAEHTNLPAKSIDLITVAQAFHWFDKTLFKAEAKRILTQNAYVSLVYNSRVLSESLIIENAEICKTYCPSFQGFSNGIFDNNEEFSKNLHDFFIDNKYEYKEFENSISLDLNGFIGRNLSSSFAIGPEDKNYTNFINALSELFYKYNKDDILLMPNVTRSYLGKV